MKAEISLGDLTRALGHLEPADAATRRRISRLLGLAARPPTDATAAGAGAGGQPAIKPKTKTPTSGEPPASKPPEPEPPPLDPREERPKTSTLRRVGGQPLRRPPRRVAPLDELLAEDAAPPFELADPALLTARWRRAILTTALETPAAAGPLDVERLVERIARGEPISDLPRLGVPTLERGVEVLVDSREGLAPFSADQRRLAEEIVRVIGRDQARVLTFSGLPDRGAGEGSVFDWQPYEPPAAGRPVLLLTDLGIGARGVCRDRAEVDEWAAFAERLSAAGNPVLAFVPYPKRRWPRRLARRMLLVHWDRAIGVTGIRRRKAAFRGDRR